MAISYTLVQRKDMSKGALEDAKLYYALAVNTRRVDFDDLCDEIAETCTLTSADIKAVLDRVIWAMVSHLKNSELVQFGDLGNFRISASFLRTGPFVADWIFLRPALDDFKSSDLSPPNPAERKSRHRFQGFIPLAGGGVRRQYPGLPLQAGHVFCHCHAPVNRAVPENHPDRPA